MPVSILVDEHIPFAVVEGLRRRGIQTTTLNEAGLLSEMDIQILEYAKVKSLVVYTRDADFIKLHSWGHQHAGILYHHPQAYSIGEAIRRVVLACEILSEASVRNKIHFL